MLRKIWQAWRRFGLWMGNWVARVVLTVFYFTIALPFGLVARFTQDTLDMRGSSRGWVKREDRQPSLAEAKKLY